MSSFLFTQFVPPTSESAKFDELLRIFNELILITGGNVSETLDWMAQLDRQYKLTDDAYAMGHFIQDLKDKGYISEEKGQDNLKVTAKTEKGIRQQSLDEIFGKLRKSKAPGQHQVRFGGKGEDATANQRPFEFGDSLDQIALTESIKNAQINHGIEEFSMYDSDLEINEQDQKTTTSTVLMIDISHSMILYGEDRITPAKKVALAMAELIKTKYPKDSLDVIVFGNDAWPISIKDIPYLQVGPYHTNTVAGLELSLDILAKKKTKNKQIFMITDGKPTCLKEGIQYYKNSFGLDRKIVNKTLNLAGYARKLKIPITTFMIATDPLLKDFVGEFTKINNGRAFYSSLKGLGNLVFEDYQRNKRKNIK